MLPNPKILTRFPHEGSLTVNTGLRYNYEMEQKHRTILRLHWSSIRDNLEPNEILPKLVTVLIETDKEDIKTQSARQERCDKLLEILLRRGPTAFEVFVEALKQTVPHLAVDLIEAGNKEERNRSILLSGIRKN